VWKGEGGRRGIGVEGGGDKGLMDVETWNLGVKIRSYIVCESRVSYKCNRSSMSSKKFMIARSLARKCRGDGRNKCSLLCASPSRPSDSPLPLYRPAPHFH
jgi:hypothetical protein